jgi:hypothetical protein
MALRRGAMLCVFLILWASAAHPLTLGPAEQDGFCLSVDLQWKTTEGKGGINAEIILRQDEIIVDRFGLTPAADNEETACGKRISKAHDPKKAISPQEMAAIMDCQDRVSQINILSIHSSVILDSKHLSSCASTKLSEGTYKLCAEVISNSPDVVRLQYEEYTKYGQKASVDKVRFDLKLLRQSENPTSSVVGCTAKIVAAFTLSPGQTNKLAPLDQVLLEQCHA